MAHGYKLQRPINTTYKSAKSPGVRSNEVRLYYTFLKVLYFFKSIILFFKEKLLFFGGGVKNGQSGKWRLFRLLHLGT